MNEMSRVSVAAKGVVVVVAAVVLSGCLDGFAALGPVADQREADVPEWLEHEDEASILFLREVKAHTISIDIIHGQLMAGTITAREAELAFNPHLVASAQALLGILKGPNGPAYAEWINRRSPGGGAPSSVQDLIRRAEGTIKRGGGAMIAPPANHQRVPTAH